MEISPIFAGRLFASLFPWVSSGGEYAGRLSGFRAAGDLSYLVTVLAPFVVLCPAGSALARLAAKRGAALLFGLGLAGALQPLAALTGDCYEAASIPLTRLASMAGWDGALRLRGDDVFTIAQVAARQHSVSAWGLFLAGCIGGVVVGLMLLRLSGGVAPQLMRPAGSEGAWTRRSVLSGALGVACITAGVWILQRVYYPRRLKPDELQTIAAFLETLLPVGEFPGARQTEILARLIPACESDRRTRRAVLAGIQLLDRQARTLGARNFLALSPERRFDVVAECAAATEATLPRFFYRTVRDQAMRLHYSHKLAWSRIGLDHPPQPAGYLDYWQPPHA